MKNEKFTIVSSCNDGFAPHLATLYVSILENSEYPNSFSFFVIDDEISAQNKLLLMQTVNEYSAQINFLEINKDYFSHAVESDRIPQTAYYRIVAPELFRDTNVDKLLYLDCDMVALEDVAALWDIDLGDYLLAAVEDAGFHHRLEKMKIKVKSPIYFNSGFMLINVKRWLEERVTTRVLDFIDHHPEKLKFHDQDALNAVLHDQWLQLHPSWNAQSYILNKEVEHPTLKGEKAYVETRKNPKIIHFSGHIKPWHKEFTASTQNYYDKYYELTAFSAFSNTFKSNNLQWQLAKRKESY